MRLRALADAPFAFSSTYEEWKGAPESAWRQRLRGNDRYNLVALVDGVPSGMASGIAGERARTAELISMWVDPAVRGSGLAGELIERIASWAAERADELWLAVVPTNGRALALYRRHGFVEVDELGDPLPDGSGHEVLMRRVLRAGRV